MKQNRHYCNDDDSPLKDYGAAPVVLNIDRLAKLNPNYRLALWTGEHLQVTLMSIPSGGDIGVEIHDDTDQFIRIESGHALVKFGKSRDALETVCQADACYAALIPAGTWHNIVNTGDCPLKLYSVYAPPHHPFGTVQKTKCD